MSNRKLDSIDQALIGLLEHDARQPAATLARKVGLSRTAVQDRLKRLERDGVIAGYTVRLGRAAGAGRSGIGAHVMLTVQPKRSGDVVSALAGMPSVLNCYAASGTADLIAVVRTATTEALDDALDAIGRIPGVERTLTSVLLSTKFERAVVEGAGMGGEDR